MPNLTQQFVPWKVRFSYRVRWMIASFFHFFLKRIIPEFRGADEHSMLISNATYSPWRVDVEFGRVMKQMGSHSLLDTMRLYELWQLVDQVKQLPGDAIEIGCWRGGAGCLIAHRLAQDDQNGTVFLCDTFQGVVKAGPHDRFYQGGELADSSAALVTDLAKQMNLNNIHILAGMFPEDTGETIEHRQFKFAHIDVDVYQSVRDAFEWLKPRLVEGAVVVFDDYGFASTNGVRRYIDELHGQDDVLIVRNLNGQAVLVKRGYKHRKNSGSLLPG